MKRGAMHHTKMTDLCERLDVPRYVAVGILESLWHLTAREAPRGDIGRMSDERIASGIDYPRKKIGELIRALVASGWLDECADHRLVIHDWHDHADEAVKKALIRSETPFIEPRRDMSRNVEISPDISAVGSLPVPVPVPCQSLAGALPLPEPEPRAACAASEPPGFTRFWKAYPSGPAGRKGGRTETLKRWVKLKCEPIADEIIAAVKKFAASPDWTKENGQFIPGAATWLNKRRWEAAAEMPKSDSYGEGLNFPPQNADEIVRMMREAQA